MKKILSKTLFLMIIGLLSGLSALAQPQDYTTTDKKAIKYYNEGEMAHQLRDHELAKLSFLMAIERDPSFIEAHMMLGYVYAELGMKKEAIKSLNTAIGLNPDFFPNNFFSVAKLEMEESMYREAEKHYRKFLSYPDIYPDLAEEARKDLVNCEFAIEAIQHPVPFDPVNMGPEINSELEEYFPCLTADGQMLLYTRQLKSNSTPTGFNEDFYTSFMQGDSWIKSFNIGLPINTNNNEGAPTLSADG